MGSPGSGVLCHFRVSFFLVPSCIPFGGRCGGFLTSAEAQGGWRQHPLLPLLLSSCRAVKKAFQKHIT